MTKKGTPPCISIHDRDAIHKRLAQMVATRVMAQFGEVKTELDKQRMQRTYVGELQMAVASSDKRYSRTYNTNPRYMPHQNRQERSRRIRQMHPWAAAA